MISGMTGFGASDITVGKTKGTVEIKSVNHRYLDVSFYLPAGFSSMEDKIQKLIAKHIRRGRVNVAIKITEKPHLEVAVNTAIVHQYMSVAKALAKKEQLVNNITVSDLLRLPGVVEAKEVFVQANELWPAAEKGLNKALASLVVMRQREGKSLYADITAQLKLMQARLKEIKTSLALMLKEAKATMTNEEFSAFQKSNDVNEELSRLAHHIDEAKGYLKTSEGVGKKLDFIAQEMQRETNTIGSKVQDKAVSAAVIAIKSKVEKIREQANNVE